jgi:uncharacterized membrane protein
MKTPSSVVSTLRLVALPALAMNLAVIWLTRNQIAGFAGAHLHAPNWALVAKQSWIIQLHLYAALSAFLIALFMLSGAKGTRLHRTVGWAWVILMMTTAVSSFFVRTLHPGHMSWIHLVSGWVAFATPLGVWAARTHRVKLHRQTMTGLVVGGLFIAGAFTVFPGRLMWRVFF